MWDLSLTSGTFSFSVCDEAASVVTVRLARSTNALRLARGTEALRFIEKPLAGRRALVNIVRCLIQKQWRTSSMLCIASGDYSASYSVLGASGGTRFGEKSGVDCACAQSKSWRLP